MKLLVSINNFAVFIHVHIGKDIAIITLIEHCISYAFTVVVFFSLYLLSKLGMNQKLPRIYVPLQIIYIYLYSHFLLLS